MNVQQPLFPVSNNATTTTTTTMPIASTTATRIPDGPQQHYWTMPLYLEIAIPLTAGVILLPLLIGPVIRLLVQTSYRYRPYWRILLITIIPMYLMALLILSVAPIPDSLAKECTYLILGYGVIGITTLYFLYLSYRHKKNRLRWTMFLLLVGVTVSLDVIGIGYWIYTTSHATWYYEWKSGHFPWPLIPNIILIWWWLSSTAGVMSLRKRLRRFWRRGRQDWSLA